HLVGVTSPLFAKVEMHQTVTKDGMAMMEPVQHMEVPAGGKIALAPGGMHIMLFTPSKALKSGDKVPLVLQFAGSSPQNVEATVRAGGAAPAADHNHHQMPHHQH
ncbi:MAG: copper chaperone PCu(A)C, partial [Magnetococcales bacterium]|nr:copper chaperone PCu(A)C [Magnetococcales bacterium]